MNLIHALQEKYDITQDWTGSLYSGIIMNWYYKPGILDISMSGYVKEALHKFQQPTTSRPCHYPHQCNPPNYSTTSPQLAHQSPESPKLAPHEASTVQQVVVTFLNYACAVDLIMLVALNSISAE